MNLKEVVFTKSDPRKIETFEVKKLVLGIGPYYFKAILNCTLFNTERLKTLFGIST